MIGSAAGHAKKFHDTLSGSRSVPWWFLLALAPLYGDHMGLLELGDIIKNPQEIIGLVGVAGAAYAAWKNSQQSRSGDRNG